jgi:hypothetical protein
MKKTKDLGLLILVLLMAIGFATVTTNLVINGSTSVATNPADFNVIFSYATTDEGGTATISQDKKSITFNSRTLSQVGDTSTLNYTVLNQSSNYDASVSVTWSAVDIVNNVDYSDYYTVTRTGFDPEDPTTIVGKAFEDGKIVITLTKPVIDNVQITFQMTLVVSAAERTNTATSQPYYTVTSGSIDTVGSVVEIEGEEFYVIGSQDDNHIKLLAKYGLNVGPRAIKSNGAVEGIQNSGCYGARNSENRGNYTWDCAVKYSDSAYWIVSEYTLKQEYAALTDDDEHYVYDQNSNLYQYLENYASYLSRGTNANITARLIRVDELRRLGCDGKGCDGAPSWLMSSTYWTGSTFTSERNIGVVARDGKHYYSSMPEDALPEYDAYLNDIAYVLRPVIILEIQ